MALRSLAVPVALAVASSVTIGMPAYNDLRFDYLDGPVKKCVERNGTTDTTSCPTTTTPLQNVVLPPGY